MRTRIPNSSTTTRSSTKLNARSFLRNRIDVPSFESDVTSGDHRRAASASTLPPFPWWHCDLVSSSGDRLAQAEDRQGQGGQDGPDHRAPDQREQRVAGRHW